ncbi:hypothetical protein [Undibacter mobilis]|uniref:hypothetical protein n=1 Tax=Undibacter mobilis TaxID=2292256 RepID=UPI00143D09EB|nr:hypothetical protein [Undibacter mobilis]
MTMRKFGRTIKMPSTLAIKHQILKARHDEEMQEKAALAVKAITDIGETTDKAD